MVENRTDVLTDEPEAAQLKGDQLAAFRTITERLAAKQQVTKLVGYAGTGKTYLLAKIAIWAKRNKYEVTVAAPTHKAAAVISEKLGDIHEVEVRTIHSLLGLRLEPDFENDTGGRILTANDSSKKVKKGLVICDEASMVGAVLKEHIDRQHNVQWLFVGDLAQLPPVGESISELLNDPDAVLEEVLRQANGSEILNVATRIRGGDLGMEHEVGRDVTRLDDAEAIFQAALTRFQEPAYQTDPSHARMLVFRNARREAINQRMRKLLVDSTDPYAPGEWLVMYAAFSPVKSKLATLADEAKKYKERTGSGRKWKQFFDYKERHAGDDVQQLHVSEEVKVTSAVEGEVEIGQWTFGVWNLTVIDRDGRTHQLPVLRADERARYAKVLGELTAKAQELRKARDEQGEGGYEWNRIDKERKQVWGTYFSLEDMFAWVDYAYCMTTHKSQGSTFDHVFIDVPDLLRSGGMQGRILYTAVTRPSKTLTFYI